MVFHLYKVVCKRNALRNSPSRNSSGLRPPKLATASEGGGGEIRTHVPLAERGLANLCHRPLGDTSLLELLYQIISGCRKTFRV